VNAVSPRRKRLLAAALLLGAALVVALLSIGASGGGGGGDYRVRAIFDSASFVTPGEDVKVAGVKVGAIDSLDVTPDRKAVIVLRIDDPAFKDFRQDAFCTIRLQSLIGEKFVECQPTQPRDPNAQLPPPLRKITRGPGTGQYLLPVTNTSSPVDIDLLANIMREPERQRFAIILNELGVGLAGNGAELRTVIRRADPAFQQFDRVLKILADQNRVLANLASESDVALQPLAQSNASISDFIDKAGVTAAATAERGDALEQSFQKLPAFLTQLRPTAQRLGEFAAAGAPLFANLRAAAPSVNRVIEQLGPFTSAALPAFKTLGDASVVGTRALPAAQPVLRDIATLGTATRPLARNLARALTKLQGEHGIQRLLDIIFFTVGSANGFDGVSHYLRSFLVANQCTSYQTSAGSAICSAGFGAASASSASASPAASAVAPVSAPAAPSAPVPAGASGAGGTSAAHAASPPAGLLSYLLGDGGGR
jgi:phospholipid/cholesterol/gamma-HCH transport system substrate-binding protein